MTTGIFKLTDTQSWTEAFSDAALAVSCYTGPLPANGAALADAYVFGQLRSGTLSIAGSDRVVQTGDIFALEPGQANGWSPSADAAGYVMVRRDDAAAMGAPVVASRSDLVAIPPSNPTPAHLLISGDPKQGDLVFCAGADGQWNVGAWETSPYHRVPTTFPKHELMYLQDGWLELTIEGGGAHRFVAGDSFVVTKGTVCDWKTGGLRKFYATFTPKA
ncbi:cupin domain-containing protein [Devosia sp. A369]